MNQRKGTRKTGSTKRTARAVAPKRNAARAFKLPVECGLDGVQALKGILLKRLGASGVVQIDASAVERIDTATLQVLAVFARDRKAAGRPLEWVNVAGAVFDAANLLNLTDTLGLAAGPDASGRA